LRYNSGTLLLALDLLGTFVFAVEGAGAAAAAHLDFLGVMVFPAVLCADVYAVADLAGAAAMIAGLWTGGPARR
jgi:uncharacterized membrane protein YeiH